MGRSEHPMGRKRLSVYLEVLRAGEAGTTVHDIARRCHIAHDAVGEHLCALRDRGFVVFGRGKWRA